MSNMDNLTNTFMVLLVTLMLLTTRIPIYLLSFTIMANGQYFSCSIYAVVSLQKKKVMWVERYESE